jgi:hypothetical protein
VTIATDSGGRQRTPTDGLSQARDATALAVRVCTWLRDEEAAGSNPATPTQVTGHSLPRDVAFLCRTAAKYSHAYEPSCLRSRLSALSVFSSETSVWARIMPRRQCQEARLALDHRPVPDQAQHRAPTRRPREPEQRDRFPASWPSIVPCTTGCPCSTSGCRRRPARRRGPSSRSEDRCRTVNTGLTATGGGGPYAAWPSMCPTPVTCWFTRRVLDLRAAPVGSTAVADEVYAAIARLREQKSSRPRRPAGSLLQSNHSGPDNSGKPVKFLTPPGRLLKCHRDDDPR